MKTSLFDNNKRDAALACDLLIGYKEYFKVSIGLFSKGVPYCCRIEDAFTHLLISDLLLVGTRFYFSFININSGAD